MLINKFTKDRLTITLRHSLICYNPFGVDCKNSPKQLKKRLTLTLRNILSLNYILQRQSKMRCTVNKLAKISGVSIRTLHWYDKIGLLKPAFYEANGYRYYEEDQLLQLQQILFFRELGFPLRDIQKMLTSNEFDQVKALREHKQILQGNIDRMGKLTDTIDNPLFQERCRL